MPVPADDPGPTALRMIFGGQLRRLRERAGVTREDAGAAIRGSHAKISRLELGRVRFKDRDVSDLLALYGIGDGPDRDQLLDLAHRANQPGWWQQYGDVLPSWFETYLGLEPAAATIRNYEMQFVPGLLQTEEYARVVVGLGRAPDPDGRAVDVRMRRQRLLDSEAGPRFVAVVDETALRRPLPGVDAMRRQLRHLAEMSEAPSVELRIVPFRAGMHPAAGGAFSILDFADPELPPIVYLEHLTSALYLDKHADVDRYDEAMRRLCEISVCPEGAPAVLERIGREL
ncbi:helix-turn-helix domain-containing protein [Pseudonocardia endophytica]|uniref:helix-turn-helix domain-containing protein n=1 Tax=Pseudonocardia endophytica TaxID=401976 RepID=UPI001FB3DD59|nr:helix-turn-helix transcriptional regulator [Pseudonocardia endophytica]